VVASGLECCDRVAGSGLADRSEQECELRLRDLKNETSERR